MKLTSVAKSEQSAQNCTAQVLLPQGFRRNCSRWAKIASKAQNRPLIINDLRSGIGIASSHPVSALIMLLAPTILPGKQSPRLGQTTLRRGAMACLASRLSSGASKAAKMLSQFPRRLFHHRSEKQGHKQINEKSRHPEKHVIKCYSTVPETHFAIEVKTLEAHVSQSDGIYFPITSYAFPRFGFSLRMARDLRVPPQSIQPALGMICDSVAELDAANCIY